MANKAKLTLSTTGFAKEIEKWKRTLLLLPALVLLSVLFVYPLIEVLRTSVFDPNFTTEHFARVFEQSVYLTVLYRTVILSVIVTFACFLIGYPTAYFVAHARPRLRIYLIFLILLPLWTSLLIRTYSWIAVLGRNGIVNSFLVDSGMISDPLQMLYTTGAVYVAMIQILLPVMILTCYSVMIDIDLGLVRAARVLGAGPWRAFLAVFFPLSLNGVRVGAIIIFMLSMGFFITPALVGSRKDLMVGNLIEFQVTQMVDWGFASALGIVLLATTLLIVAIFLLFTNTKSQGQSQ